jgi:hypothetical protein
MTEYFTPFFERYKTLTIREISRMSDADLLTECCQIKLEGIKNRSAKNLNDIYKKFDSSFPQEDEIRNVILSSFNFIKDNLLEVFENCNIQSYNFYSLMGALIFNKYGIPDNKSDFNNFKQINQFALDIDKSRDELIRIFTNSMTR